MLVTSETRDALPASMARPLPSPRTTRCSNSNNNVIIFKVSLAFASQPENEFERKRIEGAGGFVEFNRVNGNLALSRALGDFVFKGNGDLPPEQQIVSGCPEVVFKTVDEDWDFLLLACDGIW